VERKIEMVIKCPPGPGIERSSCETGWPDIMSSTLGLALDRIAGMRSGVMVTGNLRVVRVWRSSGS